MTKQKHFYLIRGLVREAGHWGEFPELLDRAFPGQRVTTIDLPGAGENLHLSSPLSVNAMVEVMRKKFLKQQEDQTEAVLVSISLGGMIATSWMRTHPHDFQSAVLINTSFGGISPIYHRLRLAAWPSLCKVPLLKGRAKEECITRLVINHQHRLAPTLAAWEQVELLRPVTTINAIRQLIAAGRYRYDKFIPPIPVLLLASTIDRMVNVACSRAIARFWGVALSEHPTAGHELTNDDPAWVVERIQDFLTVAVTD